MQSPIVTTAERRPDGACMTFLLLLDHVVIEPRNQPLIPYQGLLAIAALRMLLPTFRA